GNFIGTDKTGTAAVANANSGVAIFSPNNTVGGTTAAARNLVSGNSSIGIALFAGARNNLVQGNYVGTDVTGLHALANRYHGVAVSAVANMADPTLEATGNTVGGTAAGAGNVLSGNGNFGLALIGPGAQHTLVQGNFCGTDKNGTAAVANGKDGVDIFNA